MANTKQEVPVTCDDCKKEFKLTAKITRKKYISDGAEGKVTINYFVCPGCKKKYTFHVENEKLRKLIKQRKQMYSSIGNLKDPQEVADAFQKHDELEKKIKSMQARLKSKFEL